MSKKGKEKQEKRQKKEKEFKMTYQDNGFLYICVGYGRQETGGSNEAVLSRLIFKSRRSIMSAGGAYALYNVIYLVYII